MRPQPFPPRRRGIYQSCLLRGDFVPAAPPLRALSRGPFAPRRSRGLTREARELFTPHHSNIRARVFTISLNVLVWVIACVPLRVRSSGRSRATLAWWRHGLADRAPVYRRRFL